MSTGDGKHKKRVFSFINSDDDDDNRDNFRRFVPWVPSTTDDREREKESDPQIKPVRRGNNEEIDGKGRTPRRRRMEKRGSRKEKWTDTKSLTGEQVLEDEEEKDGSIGADKNELNAKRKGIGRIPWLVSDTWGRDRPEETKLEAAESKRFEDDSKTEADPARGADPAVQHAEPGDGDFRGSFKNQDAAGLTVSPGAGSGVLGAATESTYDDKTIRKHCLEFVLFMAFLTLICIVAFSMVSSNMYYLTRAVRMLFFDNPSIPPASNDVRLLRYHRNTSEPQPAGATLLESTTLKDFWAFAESTLLNSLYWEYWYSHDDPVRHTEEDDKKVLFENQLLGTPRIRQVRMSNTSCSVHPDVQKLFAACYDYYSWWYEDVEPFGPGDLSATETAWKYTGVGILGHALYWGEMSWYGGGGYFLDLSPNENETRDWLRELKHNLWINRGTRAVFIDFTLYNGNINLFCICKIVVEFPPMGGMIPGGSVSTLKLFRYVNGWDYFVLACELVFVLLVVYYSVVEVRRWRNLRTSYWDNGWYYLNIWILVVAYVTILFSMGRYVYFYLKLPQLLALKESYPNFDYVVVTQVYFNYTVAVLLFSCWAKLFSYLSFSRTMRELGGTIARSAKDILGFSVIFFIIVFAFAQLGYLLFGTEVEDYSSLWASTMALLQTVIGEFEYGQIEEANRVLGPIYYLLSVFFIIFLLLNMLIAIINESYAVVKSEVGVAGPEAAMADYLKRALTNMCTWCGLARFCRRKRAAADATVTYKEISRALKRSGFSSVEIELFFRVYDIEPLTDVGKTETSRMIIDLELRNLDFGVQKKQNEEVASVQSLRRRITKMEERVVSVVDKLYSVEQRLNSN